MGRIPVLVRGLLAAVSVGVAASLAGAQIVHEVIPGGDTVTGEISRIEEVDRFPFRLVEGTELTLSVKAGKGSLLRPSITLLDVDREPDSAANAIVVTSPGGRATGLKGYRIPETGIRYVEIRGANGTTGSWKLTGRVRLPKGFSGTRSGGGGVTAVEFTSPGDATATFVVAAAKGSPSSPEFESLKGPKGMPILVDRLVPTKRGFGIRGVPLAEPGKHVLRVRSAAAGDFTVKVKWSVVKPRRRTIAEDRVITDPVPTAIDPPGGNSPDKPVVTLEVAFAQPGAKVCFCRGTDLVTIAPASITVGAGIATFDLALSAFSEGAYDVVIENPDTGTGVLPAAFSVALAPARIDSMAPAFAYNSQAAATIDVQGWYLDIGAALELVRGDEVISAADVTGATTSLRATFDLTDRAPGRFDLVVTNPGTVPTVVPDAFEIRNPLPEAASISPSDNRSSAVVDCTVTGARFRPTPTVALRLAGQSDIPGTNVVFVSDTRLTCTFDTAGAAAGGWDLVVTNPDLGERALPSAFGITGTVGSPAWILSADHDIDGPPSVVYNATRNEFVVAYVDASSGGSYEVCLQRLDAAGVPSGPRALVSGGGPLAPKRDAVVAWDHEHDQYCVAWAEMSMSGFPVEPRWAVFAQRIRPFDLGPLSENNVKITDHFALGSPYAGSFVDGFHNYRPDLCWDARNDWWHLVWQMDLNPAAENSDVFEAKLDPADVVYKPKGHFVTGYREAEPSIVFDPSADSVIIVHIYRPGAAARFNVRFGTRVAVADSVDQKDPDLVVDTDTGRILLTWTQVPVLGPRSVKGVTFDQIGATRIGDPVTIGASDVDDFHVRKAYNSRTKETLLAWTRRDPLGNLSVVTRRAVTGGSGLTLVGEESQASVGATDGAMPFVGASGATGQTIAFWLKTLTFSGDNVYTGSTLNGTYRGREIWVQRYQ